MSGLVRKSYLWEFKDATSLPVHRKISHGGFHGSNEVEGKSSRKRQLERFEACLQ